MTSNLKRPPARKTAPVTLCRFSAPLLLKGLTVDLSDGQIGNAPGYAFDDVCGFTVSFFRFNTLSRAELPKGRRFEAVRAAPATLAA